MRTFDIDDDLVSLVWERAGVKPFENPKFTDALRLVLSGTKTQPTRPKRRQQTVEEMLAELGIANDDDTLNKISEFAEERRRKRARSPSASEWAASVPRGNFAAGINSWKDICERLDVEVGADSARRKLQEWVRRNKPNWPPVPDA